MANALQFVLFIGIALYGTVVQSAMAVDSLFQVDFSEITNGGCRNLGKDKAQRFIREAETMAEVGLQLADDYGLKEEATRLMNAFMGGELFQGEIRRVKSRYSGVLDFLKTGFGESGTDRPYLFCQHTWLKKKKMTDDAFDAEGNTFKADPEAERNVKIQDVEKYRLQQSQAFGDTPYWSVPHKAYLFDISYRGGGICAEQGSRAVTSDLLKPPSITLCPRSWGANRNLGGINVKPIKSEKIPKEPGTIPSGAQRLDAILPTSITLFHELFHLVLRAETVPPDGEEYDIIQMGKMGKAAALMNPETYAVIAAAYHYTLNVEPVDDKRVEFYAFFATRG
ncbi:hypothetical protein CC79DRAFT_359041 [Sarocladium strictum]